MTGEAAIRAAVENAEPWSEPCPVTPLGHDDGVYHFLTPDGEYRALAARALDGNGVRSLFGKRIDWLWDRWPKFGREGAGKVGWQLPAAVEFLMRECHKLGLFTPGKSIRGPGVRRDFGADGAPRLVVHAGAEVLIEGGWQPAGGKIGAFIYPLGHRETRPDPRGAPPGEVAELLDFIGSWAWRAPAHAPRLLLGWIGCAVVAGALRWRPHLQLTGGAGTGKTTLELLVRGLLGSTALPVSAPTEAGIRQMLGGAARAVIIDEIETDNMERARRVVELARLASTDDQAPVSRGSAGGKAAQWPIRACFLFSSILHVKFRPQDLTRICVLELDRLAMGERADGESPSAWAQARAQTLAKLGPGLRRRMIDGFDRLQANIAAYEHAILAMGERARVADQLGTMLAAAATLLSDAPATAEEAAGLVKDFAIPDLIGHEDEEDHMAFLAHLLSSRVPVHFESGGQRLITLGELVQRTRGASGGIYERELRQHGLAVGAPPGLEKIPHLAIANKHQGLAELTRGTRWADETWPQAAMRVPLAVKSAAPVSFAGVKSRASWVPLASLPLDLDDDSGKAPQ